MNIHPGNMAALDQDFDRVVQAELFLIGAITGRITEETGIPESRVALDTDYPPVPDEPDYEPDTYYSPADREAFADAAEDRWLNSL